MGANPEDGGDDIEGEKRKGHVSNQFPRPFVEISEKEYWAGIHHWVGQAVEYRQVSAQADPAFFDVLNGDLLVSDRNYVRGITVRIQWNHDYAWAVATYKGTRDEVGTVRYFKIGCHHDYEHWSPAMSDQCYRCKKCGYEYCVDSSG
jgi:hypothetical protein